jgi:hypothetical protein
MINATHNSFQQWADKTARSYKGVVAVLPRGNWVEIEIENGDCVTCMTVQGVHMTLAELPQE